jgi:hypothetical protein
MKKNKAPFSRDDVNMSDAEFNLAMSGLLEKGLVEELIIDGILHYQITELGLQVGSHMYSDHHTQN